MIATIKRILLTDAAVKREAFADGKPRIVRDSKIAGLHLWIGKKTKTFRYQYEAPRTNGRRGTTNVIWLGEHPHHGADEARAKALDIQARRARGESIVVPATVAPVDDAPCPHPPSGLGALQGGHHQRRKEPAHDRRLPRQVRSPSEAVARQTACRDHQGGCDARARRDHRTREEGAGQQPLCVRQVCSERQHALRACGLEFCQERARDRRASGTQSVPIGQALSQREVA